MEGPTFKKTNEPPKRANHKGNIKFPNPLISQEAYQTSLHKDRLLSVAHNLESTLGICPHGMRWLHTAL